MHAAPPAQDGPTRRRTPLVADSTPGWNLGRPACPSANWASIVEVHGKDDRAGIDAHREGAAWQSETSGLPCRS